MSVSERDRRNDSGWIIKNISIKKEIHIPHQNSDHPQRYIILDDIKDEAKWKDCQVTSVVCSKKDIPQMFLD